jgi:hypothetical protein
MNALLAMNGILLTMEICAEHSRFRRLCDMAVRERLVVKMVKRLWSVFVEKVREGWVKKAWSGRVWI